MTGEISWLRERLREESPELHSSLLRSWYIADTQWLPTIAGNKGCFNSYPHLRNLERYANEVLEQISAISPKAEALQLNAVEKYLLLAGILFHDIGRSKPEEKTPHAEISRDIVKTCFSDLGIENQRLAIVLADICCYHDCSPAKERELDLNDHSISPYGEIHAKRLAVFLKFVDELDSAYTRVYPHYLAGKPSNTIEGFRRSISSIRIDLANRTVVTTIDLPADRLAIWPPELQAKPGETEKERKAREEKRKDGPNPEHAYHAAQKPAENEPRSIEQPLAGSEKKGGWCGWANVPLNLNSDFVRIFLSPAGRAPRGDRQGTARRHHAWALAAREVDWCSEMGKAQSQVAGARRRLEVTAQEAPLDLRSDPGFCHPWVLSAPMPDYSGYGRSVIKRLFPDSLFGTNAAALQFGLPFCDWLGISAELLNDWKAAAGARPAADGRIALRPFATVERPDGYVPLPALGAGNDHFASLVPFLVLRNLAFPDLASSAPEPDDSSRIFFLNLAGAMRRSAWKLDRMRMDLGIYGIPAEAWVLEYGEHLFTSAGRETYEAILSKEFLCEVVDHMWHLAAGMFGRDPCSYSTLAARLRVGNVDRVRTAVRRIAIVTRHRDEGSADHCYSIRFSANDWRWVPCATCRCDTVQKEWHGQEWILARIGQLADPREDI